MLRQSALQFLITYVLSFRILHHFFDVRLYRCHLLLFAAGALSPLSAYPALGASNQFLLGAFSTAPPLPFEAAKPRPEFVKVRCRNCGEPGTLQVRPPVPTRGPGGWMEPTHATGQPAAPRGRRHDACLSRSCNCSGHVRRRPSWRANSLVGKQTFA